MLDQPPAENRTDRRSDSSKAGPRPDRMAAILITKRCADDGETSWHQKSAASALHRAGEDQFTDISRETAPRRSERENCDAGDENAATPVVISQ